MQHVITEEKSAIAKGRVASQISKQEFAKPEQTKIESRFGTVYVQPEKAISFTHGLPGIADAMNFCITEIPNINNDQFKLLQCLDNHALSFIVVPSSYDNQLLEPLDMNDACAVLGIDKNNLLLLFIVTSHQTLEGRKLSVNAKAPVFIDVISRTAVQYVFQNNNYEIQHFIS